MSEEAAVVSGFVDFWTHLIHNNLSLVLGLLVAFILLYFRTGISPHKAPSKPVSTPLEGAMI